jgi:hypothetical protein
MVNHLEEFLKYLNTSTGGEFGPSDILSGPNYTYGQNVASFLQLYGDYVTDVVKAELGRWQYPLCPSIRAFPVLRYQYKQKHHLYFSAIITLNDEWYEVILTKRAFLAGQIAKNNADFNRKTRKLIVDILTRIDRLGTDKDRRMGVPLPVGRVVDVEY